MENGAYALFSIIFPKVFEVLLNLFLILLMLFKAENDVMLYKLPME